MKMTLNPFSLIIKNANAYVFMGESVNDLTVVPVNEATSLCIERLSGGEYVEYEYLAEVFSEPVVKKLADKGMLTDHEVDVTSIYSRTDAFFESFNMPEARQRLDSKNVLILGCGGIGTHLAWHMTALGVKNITLVDFDTVEESNFNRQLMFDRNDIGKQKAEVLRSKMQMINPDVNVRVISKRIDSQETLDEICTGDKYDLLIKALDSPAEFPLWLDNVCRLRGLTYIAGITMRDNALIGPTFVPGRSEVGLSDLIPVSQSGEKIHGTAPSIGAMLYHISDELAMEAVKLLTGYGEPKYLGKAVLRNIFTNQEQVLGSAPVQKEKSDEKTASAGKELGLAIMFVLTVSLCGIFSPWMYAVAFVLAAVIPFCLYKNKTSIAKCTFITSSVFSVAAFATVFRSGLFAGVITGAVQTVSLVAILFGCLSIAILAMTSVGYAVASAVYKK